MTKLVQEEFDLGRQIFVEFTPWKHKRDGRNAVPPHPHSMLF